MFFSLKKTKLKIKNHTKKHTPRLKFSEKLNRPLGIRKMLAGKNKLLGLIFFFSLFYFFLSFKLPMMMVNLIFFQGITYYISF